MPVKRSDHKGDLYLVVDIDFPEDGWIKDMAAIHKLRDVLPPPEKQDDPKPEDIDEVDVEFDADENEFGAGSDDPRAGGNWQDDDEAGQEGPQCATQ